MDRLKEIREMVQRLGVSGVPLFGSLSSSSKVDQDIDVKDIEEILDKLPLTQAFVEQLPRREVVETAAANERKAAEALNLVRKVDELITDHASVASDLSYFLSQISTIRRDTEEANTLAKSLQQQLIKLDEMVASEERQMLTKELSVLQEAEDAKFETYAKERRAQLLRKKQEYAAQLEVFESERMSVLSKEFVGQVHRMQRTSSPLSSSIAFPPPERVPTAGLDGGLERVHLSDQHDSRALDDFLGGTDPQENASTSDPSSGATTTTPSSPPSTTVAKTIGQPSRKQFNARARPSVRANTAIIGDEDLDDVENLYKTSKNKSKR